MGSINPFGLGDISPSKSAWSPTASTFSPTNVAGVLGGVSSMFPTVGNQSGNTSSILQTLQSILGNTSSTGTTGTSGTSTGTTSTGYGTAGNDVISSLLPMLSSLSKAPDLSGYQTGQIGNINQSANAGREQVNNEMASRGLATSPAAATAAANIDAQRRGAVTSLNQSIPLLKNQLQNTNISTIGSILNSLPKISSTSGTTGTTGVQSSTGTTSQTGSTGQTGSTTQNVNSSAGGGISGIFGGLGTALASLFA